ncbi:MAG: LacI family DNA-binding transcriptional regulator [Actinomycetota bacterium]|nr:LacI family DNA-binding transcriptional regulator [Actinomycetota bacterium]
MKQPTILDVAERAGVSKSLVSLAMREPDRVSDASRRAVLVAAEELGYRPNAVARSLVQRRSNVIGVILSDLHNPFFADVADGIEEAAAPQGYRALLSSGYLDPKREQAAIEMMLEMRVDGLIMLGSMMQIAKIEKVAASLPVTLLGRHTRSKALDSVGVDDSAGAQKLVDHLVELGHSKIVHIHAGSAAGAPRRRAGYEKTMRRYNLDADIRLVKGDFTESGGAKAMNEILESGDLPTAVFAPNDFAALGAMEAIDAAGLSIPGDMSLVGYDNLALAGLPRIGLTTIGQPRTDLGREAVHLVTERLDGDRVSARHVVVSPSLVTRSTTGPPPGNSK